MKFDVVGEDWTGGLMVGVACICATVTGLARTLFWIGATTLEVIGFDAMLCPPAGVDEMTCFAFEMLDCKGFGEVDVFANGFGDAVAGVDNGLGDDDVLLNGFGDVLVGVLKADVRKLKGFMSYIIPLFYGSYLRFVIRSPLFRCLEALS
jgi:hypothetical protein